MEPISAAVDPALVPDAGQLGVLLGDALSELRAAAGVELPPTVDALGSGAAVAVASLMLMSEGRLRHLPIVDAQDRLVGLVTHRDLLAVAPGFGGPDRGRNPLGRLAPIPLADVMAMHVVVASPDEPAARAGERMITGKIGALPVVEPDGRVVGILTTEDLVRWATSYLAGTA